MSNLHKPSWHINREVPLALIYLLAAQFFGGLIFANTLYNQVSDHDRRILVVESQKVSERLVTLESQMLDSKLLLQRLDTNMILLIGQWQGSKK